YHLRSNSGSNGPIAKESHRFLVAGPFNCEGLLQAFQEASPAEPLRVTPPSIPVAFAPATPVPPPPVPPGHPCTGVNRYGNPPPAWLELCPLSGEHAGEYG